MRSAVLATACAVMVASGVFAQPRVGNETIEVRLVEVPVNVIDANGEPILGLTAANFELYDENQKQQITNFDVSDLRSRATRSSAPTSSSAARRNFLLLFDVTNSSPVSLTRARDAATQFVAQQVAATDRVAVATLSAHRGFRLLTSFTTDRVLVGTAITTLGAPKYFQPRDPLLLSATDLPSAPGEGGQNAAALEAYEEHVRELKASQQKASNDAQRHLITRELNELAVMGRALDRVRGRKHVILLSEGFDPKMLHGRERLASAESQQDQLSVERGEIWKVDTDNIYGNSAAAADLRTMIESMRRSDVVLHAMDIKGLRTDVDPDEGVKRVSNEALYLLTADTGGQVLKNTNDLTNSFARFLRSQDVTYTLGFRARRDTPGKFHRLRVKVVGVPAARVIHRIGYYEQAPAANQLDQTLSAGDIIMNALPVDDVSFSTFVTPLPQKNAKAEVPVILEIDGRSIIANDAGDLAGAEIFVYVFDDQEIIRDFLHQRVTFDLSKVRDKLLGRGVKFYGTLGLDPGDYNVRVLVRGGRSRNGFRSARLYVPSAKEPFVSRPMLFDDVTGWVMVRVPAAVQGTYPFQLGETTFVPAAAPFVAGGSIAQLALYTYNMPEDAMQLRAVVKSGVESVNVPLTVASRTARDENGGVRLLLNMTPPQLAAGQHELVIMVRTPDIDTQQVSVPIQSR